MAPPPIVMVLLATYRGAAFLDSQIASILWQTGVDARIVARDDGSSDDTVVVLRKWIERYPARVTLLDDAHGPTGSAPGNFFRLFANAPIEQADYVALADQDDVWLPDKLHRAASRMIEAGADGASCDLIAFGDDARAAWHIRKAGADADLDYLFQGASAGCTYVLSRRAALVVRKVLGGLTDPPIARVSHDWTIYAICRSRGLDWVRDGRAGLLYRQHGSNDYGARRGLPALLQRASIVRDSWYRQHVLWLRNVVALTDTEQSVFAAVERRDRLWLARNARRFRRTRREVRLLQAAFITGMF